MGYGYDYDNANPQMPGGPEGAGGYGPGGGWGPGGGYGGGMPQGGYGAPPGAQGLPGPGGYGAYVGPGEYAGYAEEYDDEYVEGSHPAVHWGLICGIVLAVAMIAPFVVIEIAYPYYFSHPEMVGQSIAAKQDIGTSLAAIVVVLIGIIVTPVALFFAGFLTTRETGTIGSGAFAGALAGGVAFVVYIFGNVFLTVVQHQSLPWDRITGGAHIVVGLALGSGFLMSACCGLFAFTLPPALIASLGAGLARLIWGPAE